MNIREYKDEDRTSVLKCIVELQEFEKAFEPDRIEGAKMAEGYLQYLVQECGQNRGHIFVAEVNGLITGFIAAWPETDTVAKTALLTHHTYIYISDLVVLPSYRKQGIGAALIKQVEKFAMESGVKLLRVNVLTQNSFAADFYRRMGYRDYEISLIKETQ